MSPTRCGKSRMKLYLRILTTVCLVVGVICCACRRPYQIVFGETYFSTHVGDGNRQHSLTEGKASQSQFVVSGVYWQKRFGKHKLPVIMRCDKVAGIGYAVLAQSLAVEKGTWLRVQGTISTRSLSFGVAGTSMPISVLEVEGMEKLGDTNPFMAIAQQEYDAIRERLQASITPAGSKLRLPSHPHWLALVDEEFGQVIVSMRINDLMYAAEVDFVFDIRKSKLLSVYAKEWFKGE